MEDNQHFSVHRLYSTNKSIEKSGMKNIKKKKNPRISDIFILTNFPHNQAVEPLNQYKCDRFCAKTLQYQSCFRPRAIITYLREPQWFDAVGTV